MLLPPFLFTYLDFIKESLVNPAEHKAIKIASFYASKLFLLAISRFWDIIEKTEAFESFDH